jgi:hypothetical protein
LERDRSVHQPSFKCQPSEFGPTAQTRLIANAVQVRWDRVGADEKPFLQPGHSIVSPNGRFTLGMQGDGNLVDYTRPGKVALWQSGTSGNFNAYVVMQADGNLVVYPHGKTAPTAGQPTSALFDSGTFGPPGASSVLLNSGVLVVRASGSHTVLWKADLVRPA